MNKELLTNEVTQRYIDMINAGIAKFIKRTGNSNLYGEFNDWFQDCWIGILEFIQDNQELPEDWRVWKIIHDKLVDNVRKGARRNHLDYDELEHDYGDWSIDELSSLTPDDIAIINTLLHKFEKNTKERKFIEWYLEKLNIRDFGFHPPVYKGVKDDGYTDSYLATEILGFPGTGASSYKNFKKRMSDLIGEELGYYE